MTTHLVKTLIDEQLEEIARSLAVVGAGIPRELPVSALLLHWWQPSNKAASL